MEILCRCKTHKVAFINLNYSDTFFQVFLYKKPILVTLFEADCSFFIITHSSFIKNVVLSFTPICTIFMIAIVHSFLCVSLVRHRCNFCIRFPCIMILLGFIIVAYI